MAVEFGTAARIAQISGRTDVEQLYSQLGKVLFMIYPSYYRKGPVCIKREDSRSGKQVDLSETSRRSPFKLILTADKESFDKIVSGMQLVSFETYERFLILLHNRSRLEARSFRETHDQSPEYANLFPGRDFFE